MTDEHPTQQVARTGQSDAPPGEAQMHTLVIFARNGHGTLDRVVGALRRRRAQPQTITVSQGDEPDTARITVVLEDSEVEIAHLVEQLRKIVDVRQVINLSSVSSISRELALIKVSSGGAKRGEIIELGHQFGAHLVDLTDETVTLEVAGNAEKIEKFVAMLQRFGIREIARTGSVAMAREM